MRIFLWVLGYWVLEYCSGLFAMSQQCTYTQLVDHCQDNRIALSKQILGPLWHIYQGIPAPTESRAPMLPPGAYRSTITGVPGTVDTVDLEVTHCAGYAPKEARVVCTFLTIVAGQVVLSFTTYEPLSNAKRYAKGRLYWNMPTGYVNPIPADTLLKLRDSLLTILGVERYCLTDESWDTVLANKFPEKPKLDLRVLGAYMYGKTYYESKHGVQLDGTPEQVTAYQKAQQLLYNLTLNDVLLYDYAKIPAMRAIWRQFPEFDRLSDVVLELYKSARTGNEDDARSLYFLYNDCLRDYPEGYVRTDEIRQAQQLVISSQAFYKKYPQV